MPASRRRRSLGCDFSVQTDDGLVGDHISLAGKKGKYLKPRRIPLAPNGRLKRALIEVLESFPGSPNDPLIVSERALFGDREGDLPGISVYQEMRPTSIGYVLWKLADKAKVSMDGGRDARRTFIVRAGRTMKQVGGTARDVQALAGHGFPCLRKVSGGYFLLRFCELVIIRRGALADLSSAERDDRGRSDSARSRTAHTRRALHRPWHEREALGYLQFRQLEPCAAVPP